MPTPVSGIRGITPELAAKLKGAGVDNTDELLAAAQMRGPRGELAKKLGVNPSQILELVNRADLARLKGIGDAYSNLLEEAGVDSVKELAHRVPANLHATITKVNEAKKITTRPPDLGAITDWIEQAKQMAASGKGVQE